tara:strand:- start:17 stop:250 length:234 start_codon:yes stop_codon:yes gene_type:complete
MIRIILLLLSFSLNAEMVWEEDGSLTIIDSPNPVNLDINSDGQIENRIELSSEEPTFIYGNKDLTVCQPIDGGVICY